MSFSKAVNYAFPEKLSDWNGIVLVGEAPGKEEVRLGKPFVGRSGKLLDEILVEAGIDRARCVVANSFRLQPPNNKVDHFFISRRTSKEQNIGIEESFGKFGSFFCRAEFASEITNLGNALGELKAKNPSMVLVALGRTPFWALTGQNGLIASVGKEFECRLCPRIPVIATYHPSFILRGNWRLRPEWLKHLVAAKQYVS